MLLISSWPRAGCSMPLEEVIDHEYFEASTSSYCLLCLALCSRHYTIWVILVLGHTCSCSQRSKQAGCKEETRGYCSWDDFDIILTMFYFSIHASDLVEKTVANDGWKRGTWSCPSRNLWTICNQLDCFSFCVLFFAQGPSFLCELLARIDFSRLHWISQLSCATGWGQSHVCCGAHILTYTDKTWEAFDTIAKGFQRQILLYDIAIYCHSPMVLYRNAWFLVRMASWQDGMNMWIHEVFQFHSVSMTDKHVQCICMCIYINSCTFIFVILLANDQRGWGQYIHELIPASAFDWWFSFIGIIFCHPTSPGFFQKRP